jgi:hypothetical protein
MNREANQKIRDGMMKLEGQWLAGEDASDYWG